MATADVIGGGNIEPRALEEEMRTAYLDYAMSVIVGRALPDVRDGLKPVHRRVLYAMNELGLGPTRPYAKCAKIVGEVMGNYHPHGDTAIYDTLVRMAQEFSMRNELIDGQGNFGSVDDDPADAMRYCVVGETRREVVHGSMRIDHLAAGLDAGSGPELDLHLGAFVSEGWASAKRAGFNNVDRGFFDSIVAAYDEHVGGRRYVSERVIRSGNPLYELYIQNTAALRDSPLGFLIGQRSAAKRIPES